MAKGKAQRYYEEVVLAYEGDECLLWPHARNGKGYGLVSHNGRPVSASRLLCKDINGAPPTPQHEAAHSCGNGHLGCVTKRHLSWKTPKENSADRFTHGTVLRGVTSPTAKLNESQVHEIMRLKGRVRRREIASLFGISLSYVDKLHGGINWKHLTAQGDGR